jgi:regulator of replication initiation timing
MSGLTILEAGLARAKTDELVELRDKLAKTQEELKAVRIENEELRKRLKWETMANVTRKTNAL